MNHLEPMYRKLVAEEVEEDGIDPINVGHVEVSVAVGVVDQAVDILRTALRRNAVQVDVLDEDSRAALAEWVEKSAQELEMLSVLAQAGRVTDGLVGLEEV